MIVEKAVALAPRYSKAHSRLGYAHYQLGRYEEAIASYRAALNLEPNNKDWQVALENALRKEEESKRPANSGPGQPSRGGPMGGAGGMPDFASMMNNPALCMITTYMLCLQYLNVCLCMNLHCCSFYVRGRWRFGRNYE